MPTYVSVEEYLSMVRAVQKTSKWLTIMDYDSGLRLEKSGDRPPSSSPAIVNRKNRKMGEKGIIAVILCDTRNYRVKR